MTAYHKLIGLTAAMVVLAAAGCCQTRQKPAAPAAGVPQEFLQKPWPPQEVPVAPVLRRDYRLREGDSLEIIYHIRHERNETYRIKIEDVIEIRFPFNEKLNQTEQVQSDGTLQLDLIGSVEVLDKTIGEVQAELAKRYSKFLKNPAITCSFKESNKKIEELKRAITTSPRGQSRLVPVTPDGTISLPYIIAIRAAGLTIAELHQGLNKAYRDIGLAEVEVTVNLQTVSPVQVYVMGEVRNPGVVPNRSGAVNYTNEISLLQAITQAGSYLPGRADLSAVMLIRRRQLPRPEIAIVNVYQLLENRKKINGQAMTADSSKYRYDIWLEEGDVIYVPTTEVAKRADYIDYVWTRGIRAVGGFSSSASGNYTIVDAVQFIGTK